MSGPAGPTGVITLKKIADTTYEQYGSIVLSQTGTTQVTVSSQAVLDNLFKSDVENQITWVEDFASRIVGTPNTNQSSFHNNQEGGWPGGSWLSQQIVVTSIVPQATLSGAVGLGGTAVGTPHMELGVDESGGVRVGISELNRNPTYYMRWQQVDSQGGLLSLGWGGLGFRAITTDGVGFQWEPNAQIYAFATSGSVSTTLSTGVTATQNVYHAGRLVISSRLASTFVMGEYVGNGTNPRTISVTTYTPICVWVLGKTLAGNEIGAFKITGMPSGESHPWESNPATGGATRLNRILDLTPTGFTVGSSLNANLATYAYLIWPSVSGFTAAGTYTGNGWSAEGASTTITTDASLGTFVVSFGNQFLAADVGQVMIRVSDGAVIGTIAVVTNGSHATGTVLIGGVFAGGAWRWQPRQIPIGFAPEFLMACSTSQLSGADATPMQSAPGRGLSDNLAHMQSFQAVGLAPASAFVATGSSTFEVRNNDPSATAGWNGTGKDYFWFAFKSGSPQIPLENIDYTGDGTASRTVSGASFTPGFWMGFGKSDTPKFKRGSSAVTTGTNDFPFQDGQPLVADQISFGPGSVTLGVGDLNVNNVLYRAYVATDSGAVGGSSMEVFVDNVSKGVITTNLPSGLPLGPAYFQTNPVSHVIDLDYMAMSQNRVAR